MDLRTGRSKILPIGVDLGYTRVRMAQIRSSIQGLELQAATSVEIPPDYREDLPRRLDFQADQIRLLLKDRGFHKRRAILSIPAAAVLLQPIRVPASPATTMDEVVRTKARDLLPFPEQEAVLQHFLADTVHRDQTTVEERIVVAIRRQDLEPYLAMAHRAGLDLMGINVEACAVAECFARLFRRAIDSERVTLLVDVGAASTQVVMTRGRRMVFGRNLTVGGLVLDKAVAQAMKVTPPQAQRVRREMAGESRGGVTDAAQDDLYRLLGNKIEEITDEISRCLHYCESAFRRQTIERVLFLGGEANNKRLCTSIASRLNLAAQVGDPMVGIRRPPGADLRTGADLRPTCPDWAVAIGLSLGAEIAA